MNSSSLISYGIDFEIIRQQHEDGKKAFAANLSRHRAEKPTPRREEFAASILYSQGIIPKDMQDLQAVGEALNAAFEYELFLLGTDASYDFSAHGSDWVDQQLLFYLADTGMHVVTNDSRLKNRCSQSTQASRIIYI